MIASRCLSRLFNCCMKRSKPEIVAVDEQHEALLNNTLPVEACEDSGSNPLIIDVVDSSALATLGDVAIESSPSNESTWDLDLLFSGSYLFGSTAKEPKFINVPRNIPVKKTKLTPKPRPTHFLAVKIDSPVILEAVLKAQSDMTERIPQLQHALIPLKKLHVTLGVLHLPKPEDVEAVKTGLIDFEWPSVVATHPLPALRLSGVGHFRDSVVYAGFHDNDGKKLLVDVYVNALKCIKNVCPSALVEEFWEDNDEKEYEKRRRKSLDDFHPHVTLAKLTTNKFRKTQKKSIRKIDRNAHAHLSDFAFGEQTWDRLQLLAMQWPKQVKGDGYYYVESEIIFQKSKEFSE